eukprot:CAMPEP_0202688644 /NCGR_PEP_ID=MMETSP1385-20130828/4126_1 /ASSEMBLY_ACC=CAM_ASM_000861 /TAXON_ID=933848 /ORGANISM="Elphidium margaritaceum" /LENGTH=857 /DNA_ID=CAMNT_0049343663 /DNA_START=144 /DNA_END=2717 /DNA_ORIENTATION=+
MSLSSKSRYVPPHLRGDNKNVVVAKMEEEQQQQQQAVPPAMHHMDPQQLPPPSSASPYQVPHTNGGRNNRSYTSSPSGSAARRHPAVSPKMLDEGIANWRKHGPQEQPELVLDDTSNPQSSAPAHGPHENPNAHAHARRFESRRNRGHGPPPPHAAHYARNQQAHGMAPPPAPHHHHPYHGPAPVPAHGYPHEMQPPPVFDVDDDDMDPNELQFAKLAMDEHQHQQQQQQHGPPPPSNDHVTPSPPPQSFYGSGMPATDVRITQRQQQQQHGVERNGSRYDSPFRSDPHVPTASHEYGASVHHDSHGQPHRAPYRATKYVKKGDQMQHDNGHVSNVTQHNHHPHPQDNHQRGHYQPQQKQQQQHNGHERGGGGGGSGRGNGHVGQQQKGQFGARGGGASRYNRAYAPPPKNTYQQAVPSPSPPPMHDDEAVSALPSDAQYQISKNFQTVKTEQPSQRSNRRQRRNRERKNNETAANPIMDTLNEKNLGGGSKSPQKSAGNNNSPQRNGQAAQRPNNHNHNNKDKKKPDKPPLHMPATNANAVQLAATKKTKPAPANWAAELKTKRKAKSAAVTSLNAAAADATVVADTTGRQAMRKPPIAHKTMNRSAAALFATQQVSHSQPDVSSSKVRNLNGQKQHGQTQRPPRHQPARATNMNVNVKPTPQPPVVGFQPHGQGKSAAVPAAFHSTNEFDSSQPFCSDAEKVSHVLEVFNMGASDWDNVSKLFRHFGIQYNTMISVSKRWFVVFERPKIAVAALNTVKHPHFKLRRIDTDPSLVQMLKNNVPPPTRPATDVSVAKRMIDHHLAFDHGRTHAKQKRVDARYHSAHHPQQSYDMHDEDMGFGADDASHRHREHVMQH